MQKFKLFKREAFEPADQIKYFDFWRKYYTAFSRAQDLLILCAEEKDREPSKYFRNMYDGLPRNNSKKFDIESFDFCSTRTVNLTDRYSFTSNISVYENCPRQYKFYKELSFAPVREGSAIFGMLVHQTIEDIHKAAIKGNFKDINDESISKWLSTNYSSISRTEHAYLGEPQIKSAYNQVKKYADSQKGKWERIQEAEVQIGLARDGYILEGVVDLIRGEKDTVEIVDFKSEKKPEKAEHAKRIEHIKRQLQVYAHLIEEKQQKK